MNYLKNKKFLIININVNNSKILFLETKYNIKNVKDNKNSANYYSFNKIVIRGNNMIKEWT